MELIKNLIFGALIGIANAIPGVSGGTMAVILNIYDKIMYAISLKNIKEHLRFLIPLALGAALGVLALSKVIVNAMETFPMILNFCFIGLVLGSMPAIYKRAKGEKMNNRNWIFFIIAFAFMIFLAAANPDATTNKTIAEFGGVSPWLCVWLFVTTAIATIAMILPGLSGSLILLLFGTYVTVMEALDTFNLILIGCAGLGIIAGGIVGVKIIKKMLRFHPQALYFGILGLMAGSVSIIWPGFTLGAQGFIAIAGLVLFSLIAFFLSVRE